MKLPSNKFVIGLFIFQPTGPKSCTQLLQDGVTSSGVYTSNQDVENPKACPCYVITGKVENLHAHVNRNLQHANPNLHVL